MFRDLKNNLGRLSNFSNISKKGQYEKFIFQNQTLHFHILLKTFFLTESTFFEQLRSTTFYLEKRIGPGLNKNVRNL